MDKPQSEKKRNKYPTQALRLEEIGGRSVGGVVTGRNWQSKKSRKKQKKSFLCHCRLSAEGGESSATKKMLSRKLNRDIK